MEQSVARRKHRQGSCHALVHVDGEPGRYVASVALRDQERSTIYAVTRPLTVGSATEAALLAAAEAHTAAYHRRIRRLDVYVDDEPAARILAGHAPVTDGLTKSYFRARTTARKLSRVRTYPLPESFAAGVRRLVSAGPCPRDTGSRETLTLFDASEVA